THGPPPCRADQDPLYGAAHRQDAHAAAAQTSPAAGPPAMTDDDVRDLFHRVELRLERLDIKVEGLEKRVALLDTRLDTPLEGLETRLARTADTWVVTAGDGGVVFEAADE